MIPNSHIVGAAGLVLVLGMMINGVFMFTTTDQVDLAVKVAPNRKNKQAEDDGQIKELRSIIEQANQLQSRIKKIKNPMVDLTRPQKTKPAREKKPKAPFNLQAIWYEPGSSMATIDSSIVEEGQYLSDGISQVIKIERNRVIVRRSGKKIVLLLEE